MVGTGGADCRGGDGNEIAGKDVVGSHYGKGCGPSELRSRGANVSITGGESGPVTVGTGGIEVTEDDNAAGRVGRELTGQGAQATVAGCGVAEPDRREMHHKDDQIAGGGIDMGAQAAPPPGTDIGRGGPGERVPAPQRDSALGDVVRVRGGQDFGGRLPIPRLTFLERNEIGSGGGQRAGSGGG